MNKMFTVVQTSAGKGKRSRPLNLSSETTMIPKGLMRIMGIPIAEIQLLQLKDAGISEVYVVAQFLENRQYLSERFGDGQRFGLNIFYSDPRLDYGNNGSGDAILTNIVANNLDGHTLWFPNDNLFELDICDAYQRHEKSGSAVSILTIGMAARQTIRNYGLVLSDPSHRVTKLVEKPKDEATLMEALNAKSTADLDRIVDVSTGGYFLNNDILREVLSKPWVQNGRADRSKGFDMAKSLIAGLLREDYTVSNIPIDSWGDFGTTYFLLETFPRALEGGFPSIQWILKSRGHYHDDEKNVWIHPDTLKRVYPDGLTLEERMKKGAVKIGPNVFLGRGAYIEDDCSIRYSDIEKQVTVCNGASIDHAYVMPYCVIGGFATLVNCALGLQVLVRSNAEHPTLINGRSVLGPKLEVPEGVGLIDSRVFPGYRFPPEGGRFESQVLKPTDEHIIHTVRDYQSMD